MTTTVCPVCGVVRDSRIKGTCICGYNENPKKMTLAELADAQAILIRLADDALAISIAHRCCDPHHDGRWCATCDARNAGIEAYREAVRAKGDSDARHHTTD